MQPNQHQQFINDLLVESHEGLDRFDRELLELEKGGGGPEVLHSIFRIIHTLKGTSGCLGLKRIQALAHAGESLLDPIRNGKLAVNPEIITALLRLSDELRAMLRTLEASGGEGAADHAGLITLLQRLQTPPPPAPATAAFGLFDDEPESPAAPAVHAEVAALPPAAVPAIAARDAKATAAPAVQAAAPAAPSHVSAADSAIRVDVGLLDRLMNLVGELVLARNQIVQNSAGNDTAAGTAAQRLNIITTELQESVMKTRMQPIGSVWAKYPRIVRDVSHDLGKQVRLEMEGQETELDRTVIEAIKDPLTHILRNSIDHGIESPEARRAAGKAPEGLLHLRAFHEGGQVNIEVSDDGAGIDTVRVRAKAVEKGLLSAAEATRLGEREALNLIFLPGLSTAARVTDVSGRGVGMDVVKTNIEKVGGSVDIQSSLGEGTTLRIKIPLTLAIVPALIVTSGGERFAIPQVSLVELVRLEGGEAGRGIEYVFDAPVYRLRGSLLPLVDLNGLLRLEVGGPRDGGGSSNLVVLRAGERRFGLVVDAVNDTQEIVVKPLGRHLKGIEVFAGATIMGDGRVALILDVFGLARHAHVVSAAAETRGTEGRTEAAAAAAGDLGSRQGLLVFSVGGDSRLALPLASVGRLEKFPAAKVEREGPREVVQYRGQIMPLLRLGEMLGHPAPAAREPELSVVVHQAGAGRNLGLVVGRIEDVVEESVVLQNQRQRPGVLGSAVIQGRVTELVDLPAVVAAARV